MRKLDDINKVLRENGKPELKELPKGKEEEQAGKTQAELDAEKAAADKLAADELAKKNAAPAEKEIDDAAVIAYLNKQGIQAASLEDLKKPATPEDKEKIAERKEAEKLSWGLSNGKFTRKEYETLIKDSTDPEKLAFTDYYEKAKAEDPTLAEDQIQAEFAELYGLNEDVNSRKYKAGQQNLKIVSGQILKSKHEKIFSLDSEYAAHEQTQAFTKQREQKVIQQAPAYKKDVQDVMKDIKKITAQFDDKESYETEAADELMQKVEREFLSTNYAASKIEKGWTKEELKEIAITRVLREGFPILAKEIAVQYHNRKVAGTKGIPPGGTAKKDLKTPLTEAQQQMVDEYEKNKRVVEAPIAN